MDIVSIISVSPVNPAHGRHEVHAVTNVSVDVAFTISRDALGALTAYFELTIAPEAAYAKWLSKQRKESSASDKKKGS